jgi:hypothetical protein
VEQCWGGQLSARAEGPLVTPTRAAEELQHVPLSIGSVLVATQAPGERARGKMAIDACRVEWGARAAGSGCVELSRVDVDAVILVLVFWAAASHLAILRKDVGSGANCAGVQCAPGGEVLQQQQLVLLRKRGDVGRGANRA